MSEQVKNNYSATLNPSKKDDGYSGYSRGSMWINIYTGTCFICTNNILNGAIQKPLTTVDISALLETIESLENMGDLDNRLNTIETDITSSIERIEILEITGNDDTSITERIEQLEIDSTLHDSKLNDLNISIGTYHHTQLISSDTQYIEHNLNKYPQVSIVDSSMSKEEVYGTIQHIDLNRLNILFASSFTGDAFLS